jgi:hypothetical protein
MLELQKSLAHKYSGLQIFSFITLYSVGRIKAPSSHAWILPSSMKQYISISIVPRLWAGPKNQGSLFHTDQFSLLCGTHTALGTTVSYPLVTEFPSPGMNKLEYEDDHSPPTRARIKNVQSYTSTYTFRTCLSKHTDLPSTKPLNNTTVLPYY